MDSSSADVGLEMSSLILTELLFSLFSKDSALCCFFGAWMKWPILLRRQELWALMMDTESRRRNWWSKRPCSELEVPALGLGDVSGLDQLSTGISMFSL